MRPMGLLAALAFTIIATASSAEIMIRCGESIGRGYFFEDPVYNPDGPGWKEDGMSGGSIELLKNGEELDIAFADAVGSYTYRSDGAQVVLLGAEEGKVTVAAIHPMFSDIYTFDLIGGEVLWSSHKIGTRVQKVALYQASCEVP